ncbi:VOC family protein [Streptomyces diacarni]|uniref:VOC family protein n=1 Tax=Streptomyces diacarni TaxID=2800381 RepID=A0A367FDZ4_9ACTN|nr:VOC family protein [Streptomyces diacarni]RCG28139.1 VOC family protein [Streptomyces diacarni]
MLTTAFVPGTPNWLDLAAPDVEAAVAFYTSVFDWEFQSAGPEAGGYGFFRRNGEVVAAVGPLGGEGDPRWTVYFHTRDADATRAAVQRAGGTVRAAPMDVFTAGRMAQFTDPAGADFAVWQPRETVGLDVVMEPETLCWTELHTTDAAAVRDFYTSVFSWSYEDMPMGDGLVYSVFSAPGGGTPQDTGQGGMMQLMREHREAGSASEWHPYFATEDCDATFTRATGAGASALMPPTDAPGVGRLAMLRDPAGATFALIKGDPDQS